MLKVGITGGIGSGKTTVCKVFQLLDIPVYYADEEAKKILDLNDEVKTEIIKIFGIEIQNDKNNIDRKKLASLVFNNKEKLEKLNSIVHPAVAKRFEQWLKENETSKYILKEAAILFESKAYLMVDKVITVVAPTELKITRAIQRDNTDRSTIEQRIKNQISDEEKIKKSHYIIHNDEVQLLIPQIIHIHQQLIKL